MVDGLKVGRVDQRRLEPHDLAAELLLQLVAELRHGLAARRAVRRALPGKSWRRRLQRAGFEQRARGQRRRDQARQGGGEEHRDEGEKGDGSHRGRDGPGGMDEVRSQERATGQEVPF